jgi:uncharacterized protein (UPF0335 family)
MVMVKKSYPDKFTVSPELIKQAVSQVEQLEFEKAEIQEHMRELLEELKEKGIDVGVLKQLVKLRKQDRDDVVEKEELLDFYRKAIDQT